MIIALYAFNGSVVQSWPIESWTLKWFGEAFRDETLRDAFLLSIKAAVLATLVALLLGTALSLAVARYRFFGRQTVSFLVILPIALPGIVTGIALNATIDTVLEPVGIGVRAVHDRRRPRDLLHRRRLQQRRRPPPSDRRLVRGGVLGPRRRHLADVPPRHAPGTPDRDARRRPARLRPLVRRDRRHDLHRRRRSDASDLDLPEPRAAEPAADHQRGRVDRDPHLARPRLGGAEARRRRSRATSSGRWASPSRSAYAGATPVPIGHETPVPPRPQ